ncbi:acyltransferase family protein [Arachidicoccus soli]|nr:DUF5009 domain-containing protein [Arachidicoccus soli]
MNLQQPIKKENVDVRMPRLLSLDCLRGFDMLWIIGGEGVIHGLAHATNPNGWTKGFHMLSNQLHHSVWNGFTFYDLIFPLFIFIAGVSMPFSFQGYFNLTDPVLKSKKKQKIYYSLFKRTLLLILLGLVVNGDLAFNAYSDTRFASVLARIAIACFFAAIIYLNFSWKKCIIWFWAILIGYWLIMCFIPVPGFGSGVLTPEGNLAAYIDRNWLPGKLHRAVYDPEGLLSNLPAICSALLGIFSGIFLKEEQIFSRKIWKNHPLKSGLLKSFFLFAAGILFLILGLLWERWLFFPINKNMWTSSFVLYAGGWSLILISLFYLVFDVSVCKKLGVEPLNLNLKKHQSIWEKSIRKCSLPFVWVGMNSIFIYVTVHGAIDFESSSHYLFDGIIKNIPPEFYSPMHWVGVLILELILLRWMYKMKLFIKL